MLSGALALAACGGKTAATGPPAVSCGSTADGGVLSPGAAPVCGTVIFPTVNRYTFAAATAGPHTVAVTTTEGDADVCVSGPAGPLGCSVNTPPAWVDALTVAAASGATYTVDVEDFSIPGPGSKYAVQVAAP